MEKRILLESRGKEPSQVTELNLDNVRSVGEFEGLTEEYTNLKWLSVINGGLVSLKGFPKLEKLQKLDLSGNRLCGGLAPLASCSNLTHLCLTSNKIKDLAALEPLRTLQHLSHLEVSLNPICEEEEMRSRIFSLLTQLEYLDGQDRQGNEIDDEESVECTNGNGKHGQNGNSLSGDENQDDEEEEDEEEEEDCEEEEEEDEEDEDDEDGPGLADLYNNTNLHENEDEDADYAGEEEEAEDEEDLEEEEDEDQYRPEGESTRGKKRKHEEDAA